MKLRTALPILSASASVMVLCLGVAFGTDARAQEASPGYDSPRDAASGSMNQLSMRASRMLSSPTQPVIGAPVVGGTGQRGAQEEEEPARTPAPEFETGTDYQPVSPRTRVTFNLEDADLPDLVRLISTITGKRFILPGKLRSIKATVYAPTKVSVAEAYNAFLSILDVNGMTVVPSGRYLKIQDSANIENQPIPLYTGGSPTPVADRFVTRLHQLTNLSAEDAATLLTRFKSSAGSVTAYAPSNTLIITDTGRQIRRMLRLLENVDIPRTGEQIWIEPIHHADAADIAARLQEIFPSSGGSSARPATAAMESAAARRARTRAAAMMTATAGSAAATVGARRGESRITNIISDERTNSLIVLATERAYLRIVEMVRHLDIPLEGEGRIHVHYVQNGDASEVATTLQALLGGGGATASAGMSSAMRTTAAAAGGLPDLFDGQIAVTTHEPTNALVITSSLHDYAALRRVIERLDRPRRQVFIEAVVMELSVNRSSSLGLNFHGGVPNLAGDGSLSVLGRGAGTSLGFPASAELEGLALGVRGPDIEGFELPGLGRIPSFGVALNAIAESGDANVLSTPHIIAMDNVQAEINVGQNIPLQTNGIPGGLGGLAGLAGGAAGAQGGLAGLAGLAGGLGGGGGQRQDVGTIIRVTPHINEHDEIRLEIEEEISELGATSGELGVATINRRTAKTEVMVRDQQTVVIGGLVRESITQNETKIPILGDIPLLGALFRSQSETRQKNNLLLFLTPYIIRDMRDMRAIYERKMRERQEFLDRYFVFGDTDYEPPVDYSRTRGLVAEIINELAELQEEEDLEAALAAQPPPEHVPRAPIGTYENDDEAQDGDIIIGPDEEDTPIPISPTVTPTAILNQPNGQE
ncbi:MAG: general secretion pathway protein D [Polyangiales bacterium]|jgi:general secretion pathway protein D